MTVAPAGLLALAAESLRDAKPAVFWTDQTDAPALGATVDRALTCDLVVVGGGFTGLWAAWHAIDRDPTLDVVVLEGESVAFGASGRNGGFVSASITHGLGHGQNLWPKDIRALHTEGERNLADLIAQITAASIDCGLSTAGKTTIAVEPWQIDDLEAAASLATEFGEKVELQSLEQVQADVHSPTYLAGLRSTSGNAMVDPARLAWGMAAYLRGRGVRILEKSPVSGIARRGARLAVTVGAHEISSRQAIIATAAYKSPLRRLNWWIMPLYDHVLMTRPLSDAELTSIGWLERQGLTDAGNQFHYYRLSDDNRILWGGWDAVYYRGSRVDPALEQHGGSHELLARHFFETFPQLADVTFTHRWAGPIDSTSRFTAVYGTSHGGAVAFAAGHTGLGVGAARFSAEVALDLLAGVPTTRTGYGIVTSKPVPIPPEPVRNPLVQFTRSRLLKADDNEGRRGLWLRTLDHFGVGFNS